MNIVYQIHAARSIERTDSSEIAHIMAIFVICLTQAEGLITGTMVKMFTIAGPVIVSNDEDGVAKWLRENCMVAPTD